MIMRIPKMITKGKNSLISDQIILNWLTKGIEVSLENLIVDAEA